MRLNVWHRLSAVALAVVATSAIGWPATQAAPGGIGRARAVLASGAVTAVLADTGPLEGTADGRDAVIDDANVPSLVSGEVLRAVTVGWPDQVASEASLANLDLTVGGAGIAADFVMSRVLATAGSASAASTVGNLSINGVPIAVTGQPNQTVAILGGRVVINEHIVSLSATTVNALHVTVFGIADVVIASATAGFQ
jgi:hypothetical protein